MLSAYLTLQLKSITVGAVLVSQVMERLVLQILLVVMLSTTATLLQTVCMIKVQLAIGAGVGRAIMEMDCNARQISPVSMILIRVGLMLVVFSQLQVIMNVSVMKVLLAMEMSVKQYQNMKEIFYF